VLIYIDVSAQELLFSKQ